MTHQVLRGLADEHEQLTQTLSDCDDLLEEVSDDLDNAKEDYAIAIDEGDTQETEVLACRIGSLTARKVSLEQEHKRLTKEVAKLEQILDQLESCTDSYERYGNWHLPIDFITEEDFIDHVQDMVSDMHGELPWWIAVDWNETAGAVKQDYHYIEIDGTEYWYR